MNRAWTQFLWCGTDPRLFIRCRLAFLASLLLGILTSRVTHGADGFNQWTLRNPLPTSASLSAITFSNGSFVAVGQAGTVLTSANGQTWMQQITPTTNWLYGIAQGNSLFVAVGENNTVLTSLGDGAWAQQTNGVSGTLRGIGFGQSLFVAVGDAGKILTSPDAVTWREQVSGTAQRLFGITHGNGLFIAVGDGGTILTSPDAITWTRRPSDVSEPLFSVIARTGGFLAVGGGDVALSSLDGIKWTRASASSTQARFAVVEGVSLLASVGAAGRILASTNGVQWAERNSGTTLPLRAVTFGNGSFVAVGDFGTILDSPNGVDWRLQTHGPQELLFFCTFGGSKFLAGGANGTLLTSSDGTNWAQQTSGATAGLLGATFGRNTHVVVGDTGTILSSANAIDWQKQTSGTAQDLRAATFGSERFVAVGQSGRILSSSNAVNWMVESTTNSRSLNGVVFAQARFIAVGDEGAILTSQDGQAWTERSSGTTEKLSSVNFGNGMFMAVGSSGAVSTSSDGVAWTLQKFDNATLLLSVAAGGGRFVAVGSGGVIASSVSGTNWSKHASGTVNSLFGVASGLKRMIAVGARGTILESGEVIPPPPVVSINVEDSIAREPGEDGALFSITRAGSDEEELLVRLGFTGDAKPGFDYAAPAGFVIIPPQESAVLLRITPLDDAEKETPEEVIVSLLAGPGYQLSESTTAKARIIDNDATLVSIVATAPNAYEGSTTNGLFTLTRTSATNDALTVRLQFSGTAISGEDYAAITNSVVIPAGKTNATVQVVPVNDTLREGVETVVAAIVVTADYTTGESPTATVTIIDDDINKITLAGRDLIAAEPGVGVNEGLVAVTRTGSTNEAVTVKLAIGGTAAPGADYRRIPDIVVIPAGLREVLVPFVPLDDNVVEPTKLITFTLLADPLYEIGEAYEAIIRLEDNDKDLPPILRPPISAANGDMVIPIISAIGQKYRIEASSDFRDWTLLAMVTQTEDVLRFRDTTATNVLQRFYRAVVLPDLDRPVLTILRPPSDATSREFTITISAPLGQTYRLESSADLRDWVPLTTVTQTEEAFRFRDTGATNVVPRFYRAVMLP